MSAEDAANPPVRRLCTAQIIGTFGGGGAQRLAYNLAVGLAEYQVRSFAVALRTKGDYGETARPDLPLVELGANPRNPLSLLRALVRLRKLVHQERIDILHVHGSPSLPFVALAMCLKPARPKLVFTWQDSESVLEHRGWRERIMIWALHRCDAVSGSSRAVAEQLRERAGLRQVSVFHGGVPVYPQSQVAGTSSPLIVWVGRIVPSKDPQILIRAAVRLRAEKRQFRICIVGKPIPSTAWYMDETRSLIDRLGLGDVVSAPGFLSDDELRQLMSRAEVSVQTSHTEGLSIALLEHMMSGLAIVATDVGDTGTAVEDGDSGVIIPPKNEERLADALRQLLADPALRADVGWAEEALGVSGRAGAAAGGRGVPAPGRAPSRAAEQYASLMDAT